jgi:hypothetical protein
MTPTLFEAMFEINVAMVMVAVTIALFIWFQRSEAVTSAGRMPAMMTRVGLDPGIIGLDPGRIGLGDRRTRGVVNQAGRRCRKCPREDVCDRWLAGSVEGGNGFCANAQTFRGLT